MNAILEELNGHDRATLADETHAERHTLPEAPVPEPGEGVVSYGGRLLVYLIQHECTATLTNEQLVWAEHAAVYAVAAREISQAALARISAIRHLIAACQRWRAQTQITTTTQTTAPNSPNEGPMARLRPSPGRVPPAGVSVEIAF